MTAIKRYSEDDGGFHAAALTYYTFFSIFPVLLFGASLLGLITFISEDLKRDILDAGFDAVPLLRDVMKPDGLEFIQERRSSLALTALVMALYSGSGAVVALEHALNKIYRAPEEPNFLIKRLRSLKWLALLGVTALISVVLGTIAGFVGRVSADITPAGAVIGSLLGHAGGIVVGLILFVGAFKLLPACELRARDVLPGAIFAAVSFEILKVVGTFYLARGAGTREATFGAFAVAAGLLVASYILAQVTLLAAELNAALAERRTTRQSAGGPAKEAT